MDTIDFTKQMWGHALHGFTFSQVKNYGSWLSRWYDDFKSRRRYSVSVHSSVYPKIGDLIKYNAESGVRTGKIYHIDYCRDPKDMFTLHILVTDRIEKGWKP